MVQNFLSVISDVQSGCETLLANENPKHRIYPVTSQEDGVTLKPGLQVDSHQGIIVGTKKDIDFRYVCNNELPDAEVLKNEMAGPDLLLIHTVYYFQSRFLCISWVTIYIYIPTCLLCQHVMLVMLPYLVTTE